MSKTKDKKKADQAEDKSAGKSGDKSAGKAGGKSGAKAGGISGGISGAKSGGGTTLADKADKYKLYQKSVQEPEHEMDFFEQAYDEAFGKKPKVLREDFCGTFAVCCEWVKQDGREAYGVDLDDEPLNWGRANNLAKLKPQQQERITLIKDDVRSNSTPKADILAAQNFSFWYFKTRDELRDYFKIAHSNLADDGLMVMDMMGGGECITDDQKDTRKVGSFKYIWEQATYDPITHDASFYIHFKFKDGSKLKRAFEYHWRFWTIPEVTELLKEAGFSQVHVYWEGTDKHGEGNGEWSRMTKTTSEPCWIAYIVAVR